jgi:hypothetical protein
MDIKFPEWITSPSFKYIVNIKKIILQNSSTLSFSTVIFYFLNVDSTIFDVVVFFVFTI